MNNINNTDQIDSKLDLILTELKEIKEYTINSLPKPNVQKLMEALENGQSLTTSEVQVIIKRSTPVALRVMQDLATNNKEYILRYGITKYGYKIMKDYNNMKDKVKFTFNLLLDKRKEYPGRTPKLDLPEMQNLLREHFNEEVPNEQITNICAILKELIPNMLYSQRTTDLISVFEEKFIIYRGNNLEMFQIM